ncbi:hypothetical protein F4804DRAFT_326373 [Jackrogersella minutella]|nr:hypothetical protein F4804DRAFT_326373 [Jackrogersella minutella]
MADTPLPPHFPATQLRSRTPPLPHSSSISDGDAPESHSRRRSLPFVFPPLFPKNTSSTFLIPSTAEGRPIPLDGSTAAYRTTALRQLSRSQPSSRRRYTGTNRPPSIKSTTTETYSQPVVVRTYSGIPPSSSTTGPVSVSAASPTSNIPSQRPSRNGKVKSMLRHKRNEKARVATGAKLPPVESFTFKSIIGDIQQDVGADLDRIAEICARTRYSLSNQYEVHIAPQGSGAGSQGPRATTLKHNVPIGPTLQAISSDDERTGSVPPKRRRNMARRRSVAYGTLETIMSSSRSSDEDRSNKRPAADIVQEVRGRATITTKGDNTDSTEDEASSVQQYAQQVIPPPRSVLFATAIIDNSRNQAQDTGISPKTAGAILSTSPAKAHRSRNHLQTKTSPAGSTVRYCTLDSPAQLSEPVASESVAAAAIAGPEEPKGPSSLLSGFGAWLHWEGRTSAERNLSQAKVLENNFSYAENTLKKLLKSTESIDK